MVDAAGSVVARLMFHTMSRLSQACVERIPALLFVHPQYLVHMSAAVQSISEGDAAGASAAIEVLLSATDATLKKRVDLFG